MIEVSVNFLIQIAATITMMVCAFLLGYERGKMKHTRVDVRAYIRRHYPDQWAAYRRGISEGYAQGLRDGQEMPEDGLP
ncbi:MAG TPA: hypothetical protein VF960_12540 [Chloroflexota bacterium]